MSKCDNCPARSVCPKAQASAMPEIEMSGGTGTLTVEGVEVQVSDSLLVIDGVPDYYRVEVSWPEQFDDVAANHYGDKLAEQVAKLEEVEMKVQVRKHRGGLTVEGRMPSDVAAKRQAEVKAQRQEQAEAMAALAMLLGGLGNMPEAEPVPAGLAALDAHGDEFDDVEGLPGPSDAELAKIEAEMPNIEAELAEMGERWRKAA